MTFSNSQQNQPQWNEILSDIFNAYSNTDNAKRIQASNTLAKIGLFKSIQNKLQPAHLKLCEQVAKNIRVDSSDKNAILNLFALAEYLLFDRHSETLAGRILHTLIEYGFLSKTDALELKSQSNKHAEQHINNIDEIQKILREPLTMALKNNKTPLDNQSVEQRLSQLKDDFRNIEGLTSNYIDLRELIPTLNSSPAA